MYCFMQLHEGQKIYLKPMGCTLDTKSTNRIKRIFYKFYDNDQIIKINGQSGDMFNSNDFYDCDVILDVSNVDGNRRTDNKTWIGRERLGYIKHSLLEENLFNDY